MTITVAQFRADLPEFSSPQTYPNSVIQFYLDFGYILMPAPRWMTLLDYGARFFTAHNLVLEAQAMEAAKTGAPPGTASGAVSSKSAGPLAISWDTAASAELDAGHWNYTTYGQRFIRLARMVGAGGIQLGIGSYPPLGGAMAWVGPPPWPGWFSS